MESTRVATEPKQSATYIGWGVFLSVVGMPLTIVGAVLLLSDEEWTGFLTAGFLVTIVGAILLALGALRWAEHADRQAGVLAAYAAPAPTATSETSS